MKKVEKWNLERKQEILPKKLKKCKRSLLTYLEMRIGNCQKFSSFARQVPYMVWRKRCCEKCIWKDSFISFHYFWNYRIYLSQSINARGSKFISSVLFNFAFHCFKKLVINSSFSYREILTTLSEYVLDFIQNLWSLVKIHLNPKLVVRFSKYKNSCPFTNGLRWYVFTKTKRK